MKKHITTKRDCEFLRQQAKEIFEKVKHDWIDLTMWALPHRSTWLTNAEEGKRKNRHILDGTHILALRSAVAGFLEGNTSATRPWFRAATRDVELNNNDENKAWLQHFTTRVLNAMGTSNFYNEAGVFYYDYHVVNTGAHYFEELEDAKVHVHTLMPGSYFPINDSRGVANILIREFSLNAKAIVDTYGVRDENGKMDWSNISANVKKMYKDKNFKEKIDIAHVMMENPEFDPNEPDKPFQKEWLELTYELSNAGGRSNLESQVYGESIGGPKDDIFLKRHTRSRKPFVVGKSTESFEYGEKGATQDSLGLIKSLNKKASSKDQALEQMVTPTLQGPASVRKNYITNAPNSFIPLDRRSVAGNQKIESVFQINPAIGALIQDVGDSRNMIDKFYYADFLLYLSQNPKTRTATETNEIVNEQQRVVGPSMQSLNTTYNVPVVEYFMSWVLEEDPYLRPMPEALQGQSLKTEFVSIFAQAQKAADLPAVNQYIAMIQQVGQMDPSILQKANLDKLADIYEDRLYLPEGLNRPQQEVDEERAAQQAAAQQQQEMQETIPAMAKAAKDASSAMPRE